MKTDFEDKELKKLLKSIKPDSPGSDFTLRVMDRVFEEQAQLEKAKQESIFGFGFWIILALFIALIVIMILVSGNISAVNSSSNLIPVLNADGVIKSYHSIIDKLDVLPAGIAGILFSSSLLVLLERFLESRRWSITKNNQ